MGDFPILILEYDPVLKDWDQVVAAELKRRGLRRGQVQIICCPRGSKSLAMARRAKPLLDIDEILALEK